LTQAAGLESRRHEEEIAAGEYLPCLRVVESNIHSDRVRTASLQSQYCLFKPSFAGSDRDYLAPGLNNILGGLNGKIDAFLMDES
jgi:hypothetical protein